MRTQEGDRAVESLQGMFRQAKVKGLWFYSHYQGIWFSPRELEAAQAEGRFCWGSVNWEIRDPAERIRELENAVKSAKIALEDFKERYVKETV